MPDVQVLVLARLYSGGACELPRRRRRFSINRSPICCGRLPTSGKCSRSHDACSGRGPPDAPVLVLLLARRKLGGCCCHRRESRARTSLLGRACSPPPAPRPAQAPTSHRWGAGRAAARARAVRAPGRAGLLPAVASAPRGRAGRAPTVPARVGLRGHARTLSLSLRKRSLSLSLWLSGCCCGWAGGRAASYEQVLWSRLHR